MAASDAMVGLAQARHATVIADKESPTGALIVFLLVSARQVPLLDTLVVV